jgi:hypothetical protein
LGSEVLRKLEKQILTPTKTEKNQNIVWPSVRRNSLPMWLNLTGGPIFNATIFQESENYSIMNNFENQLATSPNLDSTTKICNIF